MTQLYSNLFPYILSTTVFLGAYLTYKYWPKVKKILIVSSTVSAVFIGLYLGVRGPEIREIQKIVEVPRAEEKVEDLLEEIPESYGVSKLVVEEVIKKESNGKHSSLRFEPHHMSRAAKFTNNPDEQRMYASSHGLMQVMAWHLPPMGLTWSDLYDKRINIEVGTKILKDCLLRQKGTQWEKYHEALVCYNGSTKYADDVMNRVGRRLAEERL
jgi:soluble lytic murein transglycosylase-like protein